MRFLPLLSALSALLLQAQNPNQPSADYLYPTGPNAPLNTKVLVHVPCCGYPDNNAVTLRSGAQTIAGSVQPFNAEAGAYWAVFTPAQPFQPSTTYTATISMANRPVSTYTFTTGTATDSTPPRVVSTTPAPGQDAVYGATPVSVRFSEPIHPGSLHNAGPGVSMLGTDYPIYGATWLQPDATTVAFTSLGDRLTLGAAFRLYFPGKLPEDLAGNTLGGAPLDLIFTTYPEAPKDGPRLTGVVPAEGESGVPTNSAIFLLFDRPVPVPPASVLKLGSEGDPNVALKVEAIAGTNALVARPQVLLRGSQDYTLSADRLADYYGGTFTGVLVRFRTGNLPDSRSFQTVSVPPGTLANVKKLQWRFNRAVNPYLLPWLVQLDQTTGVEPPLARLSEDALTIEADVPGPGRYALAGYVLDRITAQPGSYTNAILVQAQDDDRPPALLATFPGTASAPAPPSVVPVAVFDKAVNPFAAGDVILWRGDERVPADVSQSLERVTIRPRQPLPAGDYRVELRAPRDFNGFVGPDASWTFRVDAVTASGQFRIESVEPADRSSGVDPRTPIVIRFNRAPNCVNLIVGLSAVSVSSGGSSAGRWRCDESQAIFEPEGTFPPLARVSWGLFGLQDYFGMNVSGSPSGSFWTGAAAAAPEPFRILSISPRPGETGVSGEAAVTIQFNEPALASTVNGQNIALFKDGKVVSPTLAYNPRTRRASLNVDRQASGTYQLIAGAGVRSQAGAPLEPFSAEVRLNRDVLGYALPLSRPIGPFIAPALTINNGILPVGEPVVVMFNQAMPQDLVQRAFRLVAAGREVAGRFEWTPDSRAFTFFPAAAIPAETDCWIFLSYVPWGGRGGESKTFRISAFGALVGSRSNIDNGTLPTDTVIDIEFDRDRPADYIQSAAARYGNEGKSLPLSVTPLSARVFRLRSAVPFNPSTFYHIVGKTADVEVSRTLRTQAFATPVSREATVGPTVEMGEAPLNAMIWLQSRTPINPIALRAALTSGGVPVPFTVDVRDSGFLIVLRPHGLLRGNSTYIVSFAGLEDSAGRALPDRSWTFRTAAGPDLKGARLVSFSPTGVAPASSVLRATFDKPVFFGRTREPRNEFRPSDFAVQSGTRPLTGSISSSPDGRTLSYIPDEPWPLNTPVSVEITYGVYNDWTGGSVEVDRGIGNAPLNPSFMVAGTAGDAPPVIDARNPYRDAVDAPLNAQIQVRFAEPVLASSLGQVRLESDGSAVTARVSLESNGRTITILPARLDPERVYTVVVEGVRNGAGVAQETADSWSFRTSSVILAESVSATVVPVSLDPLALRVYAPRPINPVSVTADEFRITPRGIYSAVSARVEPDGRSILVEPVQPTTADTQCALNASIRDWAGNPITIGSQCVLSIVTRDSEPPRVETTLPLPGAPLAWNEWAVLIMDEPFSLRDGLGGVRIRSNGVEVPSAVRSQPSSLLIRPAAEWLPGAAYEIEVRGMIDRFGNEAPPVRWDVTVSFDPAPSNTPRVVSWTPAFGAVGVPPDTTIAFQFSETVVPASPQFSPPMTVSAVRDVMLTLTERYRAVYDGATVRLTGPPLPAGWAIQASVSVQDLTASGTTGAVSFSTAASPDTTPPRLESITPPAGTRLSAGLGEFVLRFSEPVLVGSRAIVMRTSGSPEGPREMRVQASGDGRTIVASFELFSAAAVAVELQPTLTDLAGNPVAPAAFDYTVEADDVRLPKVLSFKPTQAVFAPLDAPIEIAFNQAIPEASLASALSVWNDGAFIPVTLSPDADWKVYRVTPSAPWKPNSVVAVQIAPTLYAASGALLSQPFTANFRTVAATANNTSSNALAALTVTAEAVDLRFAEPRDTVPDEPFGIRLGQRRVPARIERLGKAWYRLTPDEPLDPSAAYILMAGPEVELPLRIAASPAAARATAPAGAHDQVDEIAGVIRVPLSPDTHPFAADTLEVHDETGRRMPHAVSLIDDGRAVRIEVYGPRTAHRVMMNGRAWSVRGRAPLLLGGPPRRD